MLGPHRAPTSVPSHSTRGQLQPGAQLPGFPGPTLARDGDIGVAVATWLSGDTPGLGQCRGAWRPQGLTPQEMLPEPGGSQRSP